MQLIALEFRCLSHIPAAVGKNPAHFDLDVAGGHHSGDWLVLHLQELISLAYQVGEDKSIASYENFLAMTFVKYLSNNFLQISTIQFENMRHIGVALLSTIMDKVPVHHLDINVVVEC